MRRILVGTFSVALLATVSWSTAGGQDAGLEAARARTINHMKELGIALQNHHDTYKRFPPPAILSGDGKPLLSWRVKILQFVDPNLYSQFHLDEPWDSQHNKQLIAQMPDVFECPASKVGGEYRTVFAVPRGNGTMFSPPEGVQMRKMIDGTSNTIAVVEVDDDHAVVWTRPDDWKFNPADPTAGLGGHFPGVFLAGAADASVHAVPLTTAADALKALFTYSGREVAHFPDR
jgi:hypothetical protein